MRRIFRILSELSVRRVKLLCCVFKDNIKQSYVMSEIASSGKILIEKKDNQYTISRFNGSSHELLITTTSEYFSCLQFIATCLGYDVYRISREGTLYTNYVRIFRTMEDMYEIGIALNSITLSQTDASDLMKCIEVSSGWDNDDIASGYGLKKDNKPNVKTMRDGKPFPGYSPSITGDHFGISIEGNSEVRIYLLADVGDWVDVFTLYDVDDIAHIKQAFCMVKDAMDWSQPVYISSHGGVFDYEPEYDDRFVKVSIGGEIHLFGGEDISDLIRVIGMIG